MLEGFELAGALKWGTAGFLDQGMNPLEKFVIGGLPVEIILPGLFRKNQLYSARACSWPPPAFRLSMASINRRALLGERSR